MLLRCEEAEGERLDFEHFSLEENRASYWNSSCEGWPKTVRQVALYYNIVHDIYIYIYTDLDVWTVEKAKSMFRQRALNDLSFGMAVLCEFRMKVIKIITAQVQILAVKAI